MTRQNSPEKILRDPQIFGGAQFFTGHKFPDNNFPGNFLLVENASSIYSFHVSHVLTEERLEDGRVKIFMNPGSPGMLTRAFSVPAAAISLIADIHNSPLPLDVFREEDPLAANEADVKALKASGINLVKTIAGAASEFGLTCAALGATPTINNCTHYLSNAFIKAGVTELRRKESEGKGIFSAWCDIYATPPNKNDNARPVKALQMHEWFKSKATKSQRTRPVKQGFWAVFQFDSSQYCCGHVLILDSDSNKYYGTGAHFDWVDQYYYQW